MTSNVRQTQAPKGAANGLAPVPAPMLDPDEDHLEEPRSEDGLHVSEEEYWEKYYEHPDFSYEWNNGVLEVKPMAEVIDALLYRWFYLLLSSYLDAYPIATMLNLEIGFRLALSKKVTIRKPDLFVVRKDNPTPVREHDRTFQGICDLCIEFVSDSTRKEIERDTKVKKQEYAGVKVPEYFILDADGRHTAFYRLKGVDQYETIDAGDEGVIRSQVLPGFQFRTADLYRRPSLIELVKDDVYRGYVLLEYQQERLRAEQERTRAEQERTRAEQEHARAERLAAKLRKLGIDEEEL
jgi:Uma2 family endonuclease